MSRGVAPWFRWCLSGSQQCVAVNDEIGLVSAGTYSTGDQEDPSGPYHHEHCQEKERGEESEAVEFTLCEIAAANEDDILASALRCDY